MSIENAILELAAAIRELAASNLSNQAGSHIARALMTVSTPAADTIEQDVAKVETDAKAEQKKVMAQVEADRKPSPAKEAVQRALDAAKAEKEAEKEAAKPAPVVEEDPLNAAPLDYDKDVKPKLKDVGKNRDELGLLLKEFGVSNGGQLTAEQFPKILARANEILAARG